MHTLGYRIILSIICTYIKEHIWNEANCKDTGIKRLTEHLFWWSTVFTVTVQTLPRESRCPQSHPLRSLLDGSASSVSLLGQHDLSLCTEWESHTSLPSHAWAGAGRRCTPTLLPAVREMPSMPLGAACNGLTTKLFLSWIKLSVLLHGTVHSLPGVLSI